MSASEIKKYIGSLCSHLTFDFNGKSCGIDPFSRDQIDMWYGDVAVTVDSVDKVMTNPLFDGKTINEIADKIENISM